MEEVKTNEKKVNNKQTKLWAFNYLSDNNHIEFPEWYYEDQKNNKEINYIYCIFPNNAEAPFMTGDNKYRIIGYFQLKNKKQKTWILNNILSNNKKVNITHDLESVKLKKIQNDNEREQGTLTTQGKKIIKETETKINIFEESYFEDFFISTNNFIINLIDKFKNNISLEDFININYYFINNNPYEKKLDYNDFFNLMENKYKLWNDEELNIEKEKLLKNILNNPYKFLNNDDKNNMEKNKLSYMCIEYVKDLNKYVFDNILKVFNINFLKILNDYEKSDEFEYCFNYNCFYNFLQKKISENLQYLSVSNLLINIINHEQDYLIFPLIYYKKNYQNKFNNLFNDMVNKPIKLRYVLNINTNNEYKSIIQMRLNRNYYQIYKYSNLLLSDDQIKQIIF